MILQVYNVLLSICFENKNFIYCLRRTEFEEICFSRAEVLRVFPIKMYEAPVFMYIHDMDLYQ